VAHQAVRTCVREYPIDFREGEPSVQRNYDDSEQAAGVHELYVLRPIREEETETVTNAETKFAERRRDSLNPFMKLSKR
jgi:hypothetical protein